MSYVRASAFAMLFGFAASALGCGHDDTSGAGKGPPSATACARTSPRALRLLTRREYERSVLDVFPLGGAPQGKACSGDGECDVAKESCVASSCQADPCKLHTFILPAQGKTWGKVHVAGSFNGWAGTIAAGGWEMTYVPQIDAWVTKRPLDDGSYDYKFVTDETTWITDPKNPLTEPDGFGGQNSKIVVACGASQGPGPAAPPSDADLHPAKSFPVETRPEGFAFDDSVSAGLVTQVHVEQYMRAAEQIAARVTDDTDALLGCPAASADGACIEGFVRDTGRRLFRRPLSDDEAAKYVGLVKAQPDVKTGVSVALEVMLSSPFFLYRSEIGTQGADGKVRLDPYEKATLLAYSLTGTTPDDALLDAAATGELDTEAGVRAEAQRLLADPRAQDLAGTFAVEWLGVERIVGADKNATDFPEFDAGLQTSMLDETRRTVARAMTSGRYADLFVGGTTFVDQKLAALYGIASAGDGFVEVATPDVRRAGLLGQASVLGSYAYSDQTSPVRRGLFVRQRLLCQEVPPPPANVPAVPTVSEGGTTRQRFEQHMGDGACAGCHQRMDPIGFGFEHFDPIGRYRDDEHGLPIDASGMLSSVDGADHAFSTLPELAGVIAESQTARACFVKQTFRFTTGWADSVDTACVVGDIAARFDASQGDVPTMLVDVVETAAFMERK
jgi:hypothetical protein